MTLEPVLRRIDQLSNRLRDELVQFCAQPSVSAQGLGMSAMVRMVVERFRSLDAQVTEHVHDGGYPVVLAKFSGRTNKTLLFYNHYDVQPPDPITKWTSPPFEPTVRDNTLFARGAADNKGALVARITALQAFLDIYSELPVAVTYVVEGEEEIGSPHLRAFVDAHRSELAGDGLIWEGSSADQSGNPVMRLGNKGILYIELRAKGANTDSHARYGAVFPNPIWTLVWALATVRKPDGTVLVPGFYDQVVPPSPAEVVLYERLAPDAEPLLRRYGLEKPFPPRSPRDMMIELYTRPTCNIAGFGGGYEGPGSKTIVPSDAFAKLEFKLVANQNPDVLAEALRSHLDHHGYSHVDLIVHSRGYPSKTPLDHPFAALVAETGARVYGRPLTIEPTSSGTGPRYAFTQGSSIPVVAVGGADPGSMIHGPNENVHLGELRNHAKHIATIMHALAFGGGGP